MTSINPFSGYLAQGSQVERAQAADKSQQIRRTQSLSKNVADQDDQLAHQVESSDAISAIHDEQNPARQRKKKTPHPQESQSEDEPGGLDIRA